MEIPYAILPDENDELENCIINSIEIAREKSSPFGLIAKKCTFTRILIIAQIIII